MKASILFVLSLMVPMSMMADNKVSSPDGKLAVTIHTDGGSAFYRIDYDGHQMLSPSSLGFVADIGDFTQGLREVSVKTGQVNRSYQMAQAKASEIDYHANQIDITYENTEGRRMNVEFLVSNHDVAYRYTIPRQKNDNPKCAVIYRETSAFNFPEVTTTFLCPQIGPMTGWERTKPSYEEEYTADVPMTMWSSSVIVTHSFAT